MLLRFAMKILYLFFLSFYCLSCLKAKKTPFDLSNTSTGSLAFALIKPNTISWNKIVSVSPLDGATGVSSSPTLSFSFQSKVLGSSLTVSTSGTTCSGSIQLSKDNFTTCLPFQSSPSTLDSISFSTLPTGSLWSQTLYKIKITKDILNSDGSQALEVDYVSSTGFTTGFPCSNCIQTSTMSGGVLIGAGAHNIALPDGRVLIVAGGGTANTILFNNQTGVFTQGPSLLANANAGSNSFLISSGSNSGKILILYGNPATSSSLFDPTLGTMSAGPSTANGSTNGANNISITSGPNIGKVFVVVVNVNSTSIFNPATNLFTAGSSTVVGANCSSLGAGMHSIPQSNGSSIILCGGGATAGSITLDPTTISLTSTGSATGTIGAGASSITIKAGVSSGKYLVIHGGIQNTTSIFDPTAISFSAGPILTANVGAGSSQIQIVHGTNANKILVVHGNSQTSSSLFDPTTGTFSAGITLQSNIGNGGNSFYVSSGIYTGAGIIMHGGATGNISIFYP